ncbi:HAD-superfamily phosphatase [Delitschia confertaspora ATCC 74209]|uniref:HAD-superfamily phosphatase n=1 Tax=Delitschia confertaspora ATCC 74209 TaxID=1513339 RepID=A0A9P4JD54_9PLEO|nr:HAD-superfamily phosphatase [Delitschia confertaspora ATCC 74209]
MNISGTLNIFRLIREPTLCLPQATVSTFNHLPVPLSQAFEKKDGDKKVDIRAVILDKDNCFAVPHANEVYEPYQQPKRYQSAVHVRLSVPNVYTILHIQLFFSYLTTYQSKFRALRAAYPGSKLLIVSNTAGTAGDKDYAEATLLEKATGVKVLRHSTKKPGCHPEILSYFLNTPDSEITHPSQIAVVGDRLFTDVMMANMMGSHAVWVRDGVVGRGFFARMEDRLQGWLFRRGYAAPDPTAQSQFE